MRPSIGPSDDGPLRPPSVPRQGADRPLGRGDQVAELQLRARRPDQCHELRRRRIRGCGRHSHASSAHDVGEVRAGAPVHPEARGGVVVARHEPCLRLDVPLLCQHHPAPARTPSPGCARHHRRRGQAHYVFRGLGVVRPLHAHDPAQGRQEECDAAGILIRCARVVAIAFNGCRGVRAVHHLRLAIDVLHEHGLVRRDM
mmetsp:Transcript_68502/g.198728  ORF Transcript_68502/g.198728 Transcript_68502/m.198728 type:complete len:200 (+) Transcript_68502:1320-1919(+)